MRWTIPNILTVLRVLAAPAIALLFLVFARPWADWVALVLFVGAALTDYVDGWIARAWDQGSAFGKMLDPIADKAMVIIALSTLFALRGLDWLFVLPTTFILLREVLVSGLREYLGDVKLDVTQIAKWKTTVQMVAIAVLFGAGALGSPIFDVLGLVLLWIAAVLTVLSGLDYFRKAMPYLEGRG